MYFPSRCKKPTHLCTPSKHPFSMEAVWGREGKLAYNGVNLSPWYRVCTKAILISKGSYGYGETEIYFPSRCRNPTILFAPSEYPSSREAVWGREGKLAYIGLDLSPWYRVCTKVIFI